MNFNSFSRTISGSCSTHRNSAASWGWSGRPARREPFRLYTGNNGGVTPLGVWLTITIVVTAGLLLGVVLSWIDPPEWATPGRLAAILFLVAIADAGVTYPQQTAPVVASTGDQSAAASSAGLVPAGQIDPAQAERAIIAIAGENSGHSRLVESSLNGTVSSTLGPGALGGDFATTGNSELVVAAVSDGKAHAAGLEVTSLSGTPLRLLTWPDANTSDTNPAVTADGVVYFERTTYVWTGPNGSPIGTKIMRVPISRKSGTVRVPESVRFRTARYRSTQPAHCSRASASRRAAAARPRRASWRCPADGSAT
jgi:hypothetical protein